MKRRGISGWLDDLFSDSTSSESSDVPQSIALPNDGYNDYGVPNAIALPEGNPLGLQTDMSLSQDYTLHDLTLTNQALSQPNLPSEEYEVSNLQYLAQMLETLTATIGPFQLISAFRTHELQQKLGEGGAPTSAGLSFHEVGRAVDIAPTTMSLDDYFGRILADPDLRNQFAELAIKPTQKSLHLSINVEGDWRSPKITGLDDAGTKYVSLSPEQIQSFIAPFVASAEAAFEEASTMASKSPGPVLIIGLLGILGYFMIGRRQKRPA